MDLYKYNSSIFPPYSPLSGQNVIWMSTALHCIALHYRINLMDVLLCKLYMYMIGCYSRYRNHSTKYGSTDDLIVRRPSSPCCRMGRIKTRGGSLEFIHQLCRVFARYPQSLPRLLMPPQLHANQFHKLLSKSTTGYQTGPTPALNHVRLISRANPNRNIVNTFSPLVSLSSPFRQSHARFTGPLTSTPLPSLL